MALQKRIVQLVMLCLMHPWMWVVLWASRALCCFVQRLLPTSTPRFPLAGLLSSHFSPYSHLCPELPHPRCRIQYLDLLSILPLMIAQGSNLSRLETGVLCSPFRVSSLKYIWLHVARSSCSYLMCRFFQIISLFSFFCLFFFFKYKHPICSFTETTGESKLEGKILQSCMNISSPFVKKVLKSIS